MKILLLGACAALGLGVAVQDPFDDATVEGQPVAGGVHMLTGFGGNIGLSVGNDGVLMIDSQFAQLEQKIRAAIAELTEDSPTYLVNTHWHGDHTGSNAGFSADAIVVAHENVRKRLKEGGRGNGPAVAEALPTITFNDELSFHFNGEKVQLEHLPAGHTDGDSIVIFHGSKVIHMGDHFFSGMFPFVDPASGGSLEGYMKNVAYVLEMAPPDWKIIPGHGPLSSHEDLADNLEMMKATAGIMQERIDKDMARDAAIAAGLPSEWDSWSWQFITTERWLGTLYDELSE
ncbi:MAG: MBL fold metallo-hydrolase [Planctomycetota bacterium]|jgi:glyoxylase-like metal-dependent hydrolase (beta-lactamase superfamily II)